MVARCSREARIQYELAVATQYFYVFDMMRGEVEPWPRPPGLDNSRPGNVATADRGRTRQLLDSYSTG